MIHTYVGARVLVGPVLAVALMLAGVVWPATSYALSCLAPADAISEQLSAESNAVAFTGTVMAVTEADTETTRNTVAVEVAHKGDVPATVDVAYQDTADWGYGCSSGPSAPGETKTFVTWVRDDGSLEGGLAFTADDDIYDVFTAELARQNPSSSIYTVATSSQENIQSDTAFSKLLIKLQAILEQLKVMLGL